MYPARQSPSSQASAMCAFGCERSVVTKPPNTRARQTIQQRSAIEFALLVPTADPLLYSPTSIKTLIWFSEVPAKTRPNSCSPHKIINVARHGISRNTATSKFLYAPPIHLHKSHGVVISWISCAKGVDHTLLPFAGSTPSRRVINKDSFAVRQRLAYSLQNQQLTPSRAIRLLKINSRKMYVIHRVLQIYKGRPTGLEDISA